MTIAAARTQDLPTLVQEAIASRPPSYESAAAAYAMIDRGLSHIGGVAGTGVVLPAQLARFTRSLEWRPDSPGRRMTVSEALAFVDRLARASEAVAVGRPLGGRGRPVSSR